MGRAEPMSLEEVQAIEDSTRRKIPPDAREALVQVGMLRKLPATGGRRGAPIAGRRRCVGDGVGAGLGAALAVGKLSGR